MLFVKIRETKQIKKCFHPQIKIHPPVLVVHFSCPGRKMKEEMLEGGHVFVTISAIFGLVYDKFPVYGNINLTDRFFLLALMLTRPLNWTFQITFLRSKVSVSLTQSHNSSLTGQWELWQYVKCPTEWWTWIHDILLTNSQRSTSVM